MSCGRNSLRRKSCGEAERDALVRDDREASGAVDNRLYAAARP
jgi:hypothetical protein